jgi:hypothetical protein
VAPEAAGGRDAASAAAIAYARQRLGWPVMAPLLEAVPAGGPFPQIRVVGLGECGTRVVLGAECRRAALGSAPSGRATCVS